uniref:Ribonuclease 3 n=1 Tax=candidate division WWE3 bacterium TaxID=2053526 RepID=A0A831YPU3_UNCKA
MKTLRNDPERKIEKSLGIKFRNPDLLENSFVHRSYLNENPEFPFPSNERLEFLGDAVLEQIVSDFLYHNFPALPEGELTALRAALVRTESLAEESRRLGLGKELFLSKGEETSGGRDNPYLLANTFEALIGAIYLDQGIESARKFVHRELLYKAEKSLRSGVKDPKSHLQEVSQARFGITPNYKVLKEWGPAHDHHFRTAVFLKTRKIGEGEGRSKKEAEENAAREALILFKKEKPVGVA